MPAPSGKSQPTAGGPAKPPRMRAACSQCHHAKVRCSGEKTGCARCLDNELQCEYAMSMVGRTSSRDQRARPNKGQRSTTVADLGSNHGRSRSKSLEESQSQEVPVPELPFPTDFNFISWPGSQSPETMDTLMQTDPHDDLLVHGYPDHLTSHGNRVGNDPTKRISDFNANLLEVDFSLDQYSAPDFSDLDPTPSFPPVPWLSDSSSISYTTRGSQDPELGLAQHRPQDPGPNRPPGKAQYAHVLALVEIIGSLEARVQAKETAMDKVLALNKSCLANVGKITALEDGKLCKSCRALIPTAMELIVTLYEMCISQNHEDPQNRKRAHSPAHRRTSSSNLHFGVFQIEPEDQTAICNQLFTKELNGSIQIIRTLSARCHDAAITAGTANCGSVQWYTKMEARAKKLISTLGR